MADPSKDAAGASEQKDGPDRDARQPEVAEKPEGEQSAEPSAETQDTLEDAEDRPLDLHERRAAQSALFNMGQGVGFGGPSTIGGPVAGRDVTIHYGNEQPRAVALITGPVKRALLNDLAAFYVEPSNYPNAQLMLEDRHILVLHGPARWGKATMALRLLDHRCAREVRTLNSDEDVRRLGKDDVKEGVGYLVHALAPVHARQLNEHRLSVLSETFREGKGYLAITVNSEAVRRHELPTEGVVSCERLPDPGRMLVKHLGTHLDEARCEELVAHPKVQELLAGTSPLPQEVVEWATVLAKAEAEGLSVEDALPRLREQVEKDIIQWFNDHDNPEERAFMAALAVFNGSPYQDVLDAASRLETSLRRIEDPDNSVGKRPFSLTRAEQLERTFAECFSTLEIRTIGILPVEAVQFTDRRYAPVVLDTVWGYPAARGPVLAWLKDFASHSSVRIRVHAAMAIGRLSLGGFGYVHDEILQPWSAQPNYRLRQSVAWMLAVPAYEPTLAPVVRALLREWSSGDRDADGRWRTLTAATAYGTEVGLLFPDIALEGLQRIAGESDDALIGKVVSYSVTRLFEAGNHKAVLRALVQWTAPASRMTGKQATLAINGIACFLRIASEAVVDPAPAEGEWPHLLAVTHDDARGIKRLVILWRRALHTQQMVERALHDRQMVERALHARQMVEEARRVFRDWVSKADEDSRLLDILWTLVDELARTDREARRIAYNLRAWAKDPHDPSKAADRLLGKLVGRGGTDDNGHEQPHL